MAAKFVYYFGEGRADGDATMKNLLGGKGANLAEMCSLEIPVPPGFTLTTDLCTHYYDHNKTFPEELTEEVDAALKRVEESLGTRFGDPQNPLLLSVRSGARKSMPGMMETVLNIGLNPETIKGLIAQTGNERFAYDAYRRLIAMYADVVMEKGAGIEVEEGRGIRELLENELGRVKETRGIALDTDLSAEDLKSLVDVYKAKVKEVLGTPFPDDPKEQLWGGIKAVFDSWNGKRAIAYRRIENIPEEWGTANNIQAMVFGNMGDDSATGVAFTRNPATGENNFYGEWLSNAQGEDVVAGTRTPNPMNEVGKTEDTAHLPSLESAMPEIYRQLDDIQRKIETHYTDMQDIEFTIQKGRLWMLQTRTGKRNGPAAIRMAVEMCEEGLIDKRVALQRVKASQLDELLHPMLDPDAEKKVPALAKGLPASPGGATGMIVFTADDAEAWNKTGKAVILVRNETSPEDVHGMHAAEAILTAKGGMTSHAALVARGWGKCCIVGCSALQIDLAKKQLTVDGRILKEGDLLSLNGSTGSVYEGQLSLVEPDIDENQYYKKLILWADEVRELGIRTNADAPADAAMARNFGAEGIGLCRTEHMFFDPTRITAMREMIVADTEADRRKAVMKLLPFQKEDFYGILKEMQGFPVTIRLLDPPLHEFVTLDDQQIEDLSKEFGMTADKLKARINSLHELNPMLGHRGCRLGIAYPEITEMQARAIFEATAELTLEKVEVFPEVMVPLTSVVTEFENQRALIEQVAHTVMEEKGVSFDYLIGTMIETPRACLTAEQIAETAEFFSFGTNDLTQTTFGFSRDDIGGFLPYYLESGILPADPFETLDQSGVGQLVEMGVKKGRSVKPKLKIGICGEHGGDPDSIDFCHRAGLDYVSCSPFRVPIARLAAAHAAIEHGPIKK